jgi:predicted nucleic acid-binding Zn ribbon protein
MHARSKSPSDAIYLQLALPLFGSASCVVCGAPFAIERRRGRPAKFCSDPCREAQLKAQKRAWAMKQARPGVGQNSEPR